MIDPCCGIGTVVIEALEQGIDIKGYELVYKIGMNAKLKFFISKIELIPNFAHQILLIFLK